MVTFTEMTKLVIVVPCFNEEAALPSSCSVLVETVKGLVAKGKISADSRVCFVDDGSRDRTWELIEQRASQGLPVIGLRLCRNYGHQCALLAGLLSVSGDAIVTIDADLQDDPDTIEFMIDEFHKGRDIVLGVRTKRAGDGVSKRVTARAFYRMLTALGVKAVEEHADFRLMSRRAIESLRTFEESNLYLRGIVPLLGYEVSLAPYERRPRIAGKSKYNVRKMLGLALNAVTSFSVVPLRAISALGLLVSAGSAAVTVWALWASIFSNRVVPGWASTVLPIYFLGGVQLLSIGVIGEYVGKIYLETKRRPRFAVDRIVGHV